MKSDAVLNEITNRIADRKGVHPLALEPPLNDVIDPDALETLADSSECRQDSSRLSVEFPYAGYTITVDGTGEVHIGTTDEISRREPKRPPGDAPTEHKHREHALKEASEIITARDRPFDERLEDLLGVVRKTLRLDYATLSYVHDDTYVFEAVDLPADIELQAGETVPLADTTCKRVIERERALVSSDIEIDVPELANSAYGVSSYIGVPVFVDDTVYGTFCFYDQTPRAEEFSEWDLAFVELLGNWVSGELEKRQRERSLNARTFEQSYGVS